MSTEQPMSLEKVRMQLISSRKLLKEWSRAMDSYAGDIRHNKELDFYERNQLADEIQQSIGGASYLQDRMGESAKQLAELGHIRYRHITELEDR